jgi:hypothetical protein
MWSDIARRHRLPICALLALLAGCGTGVAGSRQADAVEERPKSRAANPTDSPEVGGRLRVLTRRAPDDWCGRLETTRLVVLQGRREVETQDYCSAYNRGGASLVTDTAGGHYVLLVYGEGHGTHVVSDWLKVFRLTEGRLVERASLLVRTPIGTVADHVYDYNMRTPPGGGLILSGTWIVDGEGYADDVRLMDRSRTVIALDTAPAQSSAE